MNKLLLILVVITTLLSCSKNEAVYVYKNGVYNASEAEYNYGWKGYLKIEITGDKLQLVEFDYNNDKGEKKSATTAENYPMDPHPSVWLPQYEDSLSHADLLNYSDFDALTGATHSAHTANAMMHKLLEAAIIGDTTVQVLESEE